MGYLNHCSNCVLDGTVEDISFDENGLCNYCQEYSEKQKKNIFSETALRLLVANLRKKKGKYDCIVGISGGLDSSFLLHTVKELGLRPLAVHCDSGWNSESATANIETLTKKLDVDLHTFVVNWQEFKELQRAYLRSGVIDLEFPTDHIYIAALFSVAEKMKIKTIFTGNNLWSEGIMPACWIHNKGDTLNMTDIYRRNGQKPLKLLPLMSLKRAAKSLYTNTTGKNIPPNMARLFLPASTTVTFYRDVLTSTFERHIFLH